MGRAEGPISGRDHVVAVVAVGLWGAVLGAPGLWVLTVAFPIVMAFGDLLGLLGVPIPSAFPFQGWRSAAPSRAW